VSTVSEDEGAALTVNSKPVGATVFVDGQEVCTTPCTARLPYGRFRVEVRLGDKKVGKQIALWQDSSVMFSL